MDKKWAWILPGIAGLVLLFFGIVAAIVDRASAQALDQHINVAQQQFQLAASRINEAEKEYENRHQLYADHWSQGLGDTLVRGRTLFNPDGDVDRLLADARHAYDQKKWRDGEAAVGQAEAQLSTASEAIDRILGPPDQPDQGLYVLLALKEQQASAKIGFARSTIADRRTVLQNKQRDPWNREKGVVLTSAFNKLEEAQATLDHAQTTLQAHVERGLIDRPLAYDLAVQAVATADKAVQLATDEESAARTAWQAIQTCNLDRQQANLYILASDYRQTEALAQLTSVDSIVREAYNAFDARNYAGAKTLAENCVLQAQFAQGVAATPTPIPPTPIPPPTVDWSSSSDNSGGSSNWNWGSGSSGSSSGSDWGGSSGGGSWSSPSFGGSDSGSFGGGSDFGGSDSGSWGGGSDFGGSDGGSFSDSNW